MVSYLFTRPKPGSTLSYRVIGHLRPLPRTEVTSSLLTFNFVVTRWRRVEVLLILLLLSFSGTRPLGPCENPTTTPSCNHVRGTFSLNVVDNFDCIRLGYWFVKVRIRVWVNLPYVCKYFSSHTLLSIVVINTFGFCSSMGLRVITSPPTLHTPWPCSIFGFLSDRGTTRDSTVGVGDWNSYLTRPGPQSLWLFVTDYCADYLSPFLNFSFHCYRWRRKTQNTLLGFVVSLTLKTHDRETISFNIFLLHRDQTVLCLHYPETGTFSPRHDSCLPSL